MQIVDKSIFGNVGNNGCVTQTTPLLALIYKLHHVGRTGFDLEKGAQVTTVKKHLILKYMGHSR